MAGRLAIQEMKTDNKMTLDVFSDFHGKPYQDMVEQIRKRLNLTSLKYQNLDDLVEAIGLPKEKMCTYCWDGIG